MQLRLYDSTRTVTSTGVHSCTIMTKCLGKILPQTHTPKHSKFAIVTIHILINERSILMRPFPKTAKMGCFGTPL